MVRIAALDDETCWIETLREITQEFFEQREDDKYEFSDIPVRKSSCLIWKKDGSMISSCWIWR